MKIRLEKRQPLPLWGRLLLPLLALLIAFLLSFLLILPAGADPVAVFAWIFRGALGSKTSLAETAVKAAPLVLTGLAAAVAFSARFYNLGGEGQLYLGALAAATLGLVLPFSPVLSVPVLLIAAFAAGGLFALGAGLLKTRLGVNEVVATLLSNSVVIYAISALLDGPLKDPSTMWPNSPTVPLNVRFPILLPGTRLHAGVIVALAAAAAVRLLMRKSVLGFELQAAGRNPRAAAFAGVPVVRAILFASFLSGGLAGLAGCGEVIGLRYNLIEKLSAGYGYAGVVAATLGGLDAVGVVLSAILIAVIVTGAELMSRYTGVPVALADTLQGLFLLSMLSVLILSRFRIVVRRAPRALPEGAGNPGPA